MSESTNHLPRTEIVPLAEDSRRELSSIVYEEVASADPLAVQVLISNDLMWSIFD